MASQYVNLGAIYQTRGELDKAEEYWLKSVELFRNIGAEPMVVKVQSLLDSLEN